MKYKHKKIIIVGAGMAGLAACALLKERGFDAHILEARGRAGGRIWTNASLGVPLGGGANFIHGMDGNPITRLAQKIHAEIIPITVENITRYDSQGNMIPPNETQLFNQKMDVFLKEAKLLASQAMQDQSLADALLKVMNMNELTEHEHDLFQFKLRYFEGYIGAGYQFLSARHWDQEEIFPGDTGFLVNSYQPIIEGLANQCDISFDTIVTQIRKREQDVEIETDNGIFYADAVVVTVPLGVLKKNAILFDPPLPKDKQKAIQRLGMGLLNIMGIRFPQAFWPSETQALYFSQVDALSVPIFFNLMTFMNQPILLGFYGGERAKQIEKMSDKEIIQKTMKNFRQQFGATIPDPDSFFITRWFHDPFSHGSYSYLATGSSNDDYDTLAQPVSDWLFFAGEATCGKYLATTHGAYLSGIREADRIAHQ